MIRIKTITQHKGNTMSAKTKASENQETVTTSTKMRAVATGVLSLGGIDLDCYVLEDGRRVVSQRAIVRLLTSDKDGKGGRGSGGLGGYLERLPKEFNTLEAVTTLVRFDAPGGTVIGRDAQFVVDMCKAYKAALRAGALHPMQAHIAAKADMIIDALAGVGIAALVDEATGYQQVRTSDGLRRLFDRLLVQEATTYARLVPESLIRSLCKTYGLKWDRRRGFPPALCGVMHEIYKLVLGDEMLSEVKERNGYGNDRIGKHHQFFAEDCRRLTTADLGAVEIISNQSAGKDDFKARLKAHFRGDAYQLRLVMPA